MSITCIDCGNVIREHDDNLVSICPACADKLIDRIPVLELIPLAKIGMIAVIDEVTGYQEIRMQRDKELMRLYKKYKGEITE